MHPTFFIDHGGRPCFFLGLGKMRAIWRKFEDYFRGFTEELFERPSVFHGQALGRPISGFRFGGPYLN